MSQLVNEPVAHPRFDESTFGFVTLGVGSFFTTRHFHTSLLMVAGDLRVQVDLPSPYARILAEATRAVGLDLTPGDVDRFICTHVHGDHANGCEDVGFYKYFVQKSRPRFYVAPDVAGPLWEQKLSASMGALTDESLEPLTPDGAAPNLETFFDVRFITPERPERIGDVTLRVRRTLHNVPCYALRFERADGRELGYSCDTAFDPELIEWLRPCDLIFHETTPGGPHTRIEELCSLDDDIKRRMVLIHLDDGQICDDPALRLARQGALYEVPAA